MINQNKCSGSCNDFDNVSTKIRISNKIKNVNVKNLT